MEFITAVSDFLWGYPVVIILFLTSMYLTIKLKFFQFRYPVHIFKQTVGQIGKKTKGDGTVTPFQTLPAALSSTIGAANIVGEIGRASCREREKKAAATEQRQ